MDVRVCGIMIYVCDFVRNFYARVYYMCARVDIVCMRACLCLNS